MAKNDRFERIYTQGTLTVTQIWVDKETGVNYLYHMDGYSGGLTPLLDREAGHIPCLQWRLRKRLMLSGP